MSLRSGDLTQEEVDRLRSEGRLDDLLKKNIEEEGEVQGPKNRDEGELMIFLIVFNLLYLYTLVNSLSD